MLNKKNILITGALGGLGQTVVTRFLELGAVVIGVDSDRAVTDALKSSEFWKRTSVQTNWRFRPANLMDEKSVIDLMNGVRNELGRLDGLINLVGGIYPWSDITAVETKTWDFTFELNLKTAFLCSREALKVMVPQRSGKIVNVGALGGLKGSSQAGPYGAAKAGVINLTETMADENKKHNIQINAIVPSIIDTPANRKSMPDADFSAWVRADEIANVLAFLCSDESSGVTGSIIKVPGRV